MTTDTKDRAATMREEPHLYGLIRDDAEAARIHVQEAVRHLTEAAAELRRIVESVRKINNGISPHALPAVTTGADFLLSELDDVQLDHLKKDADELAELTELVNTQAKRLNA